MAPSEPPRSRLDDHASSGFRLRTLLEVAGVSLIIYIVLGAPGLSNVIPATFIPSSLSNGDQSSRINTPTSDDASGEKLDAIVYPSPDLDCPGHGYKTHVLSHEPLVLYLDGFLSDEEVRELTSLSAPHYQPSTLFSSDTETLDTSIRRSEKALLPRTSTVRCVEARALALQGWPRDTFIERLWTQRYNLSGHYALHYDWSADSVRARRASSFMVYLNGGNASSKYEDALEGGGTHFPRLRNPGTSGEWCDFIACDSPSSSASKSNDAAEVVRSPDDSGYGVTFVPRRGSAVFWLNFDSTGRGHRDTIHAGLPVTRGQKIGLNIWSWYQAGHRRPADWIDDPDDGGLYAQPGLQREKSEL